ncbi:6,7-dimethyl-8-ribityllumazine synthase, partial [Sphaerisporangium sp. NPDC049002]|uniref:6,7-dimethyl-8-ribityllumazine synthase n=1 Tax=Sphaerisporangium sp. NPDC049002 TaxID=3155392 RepID=UPI0033FCBECD
MSGAGRPQAAPVAAEGLTVGIVAARWHERITDQLVARAEQAAGECGAACVTVRVAGSLESCSRSCASVRADKATSRAPGASRSSRCAGLDG